MARRLSAEARAIFAADLGRQYTRYGKTIRELAADHGWSYSGIHGLLKLSGVQLRPRGYGRHTR